MSVNPANIFPKLVLVPPAPFTLSPMPPSPVALIVDAGIDWRIAASSPYLTELRAAYAKQQLYVRIDGFGDGAEDALAILAGLGVDGIVLANCLGTVHLQRLEVALRVAEACTNRPDGRMRIMAELGGAREAFLPPLPLSCGRLVAVIFNEEAALAATGKNQTEERNLAVEAMSASTLLMALQASLPCYLLGQKNAACFTDKVSTLPDNQRLGRIISKTSPPSL